MFGNLPFVVVCLVAIFLLTCKSEKEHGSYLRIPLSIMRKKQFYAKLSNCSFFQDNTNFLGYIIHRDGNSMDPNKVAAVRDWPQPTTFSELRSFLGLCNQYKRFIEGNYPSIP